MKKSVPSFSTCQGWEAREGFMEQPWGTLNLPLLRLPGRCLQ